MSSSLESCLEVTNYVKHPTAIDLKLIIARPKKFQWWISYEKKCFTQNAIHECEATVPFKQNKAPWAKETFQ